MTVVFGYRNFLCEMLFLSKVVNLSQNVKGMLGMPELSIFASGEGRSCVSIFSIGVPTLRT